MKTTGEQLKDQLKLFYDANASHQHIREQGRLDAGGVPEHSLKFRLAKYAQRHEVQQGSFLGRMIYGWAGRAVLQGISDSKEDERSALTILYAAMRNEGRTR